MPFACGNGAFCIPATLFFALQRETINGLTTGAVK